MANTFVFKAPVPGGGPVEIFFEGMTNSPLEQKVTVAIRGTSDSYEWTGKGENNQKMDNSHRRSFSCQSDRAIAVSVHYRKSGSTTWTESRCVQGRPIKVGGYQQITVVAEEGGDQDWNDCTAFFCWAAGMDKLLADKDKKRLKLAQGDKVLVEAYTFSPYGHRLQLTLSKGEPRLFEGGGAGFAPMKPAKSGDAIIENKDPGELTVDFKFDYRLSRESEWKPVPHEVGPAQCSVKNYRQSTGVGLLPEKGRNPRPSAVYCARSWTVRASIRWALCIDRSGSMGQESKLASAQTGASSFVDCTKKGDGIAVVSFSDEASRVYPKLGDEVVVIDKERKRVQEAKNEIGNIALGNLTDIAAGIKLACQFLDRADHPKGIFMLSDGWHNKTKENPRDFAPADYPLYTCAVGNVSDEKLLKDLAKKTNGLYYKYEAIRARMSQVFNSLRGQTPTVKIVANEVFQLTAPETKVFEAPVLGNAEDAEFTVAWDDPAVEYTPGKPALGQVRINLYHPRDQERPLPDPPLAVEKGYVVFRVPRADPGQWRISLEYPGKPGKDGHVLGVCVGVFEVEFLPNALPSLDLTGLWDGRKDTALPIALRISDGGAGVPHQKVTGRLRRPTRTLEQALALFAGQLNTAGLDGGADPDGDTQAARLAALADLLPPGEPALGYVEDELSFAETEVEGEYRATVPAELTGVVGSYILQVTSSGKSPLRDADFQRSELLAFYVS